MNKILIFFLILLINVNLISVLDYEPFTKEFNVKASIQYKKSIKKILYLGNNILLIGFNKSIHILKLHLHKSKKQFDTIGEIQFLDNSFINALIALDDNRFAVGTNDGKISIWDLRDLSKAYDSTVTCSKINSLLKIDENIFASCHENGYVFIWEVDERILFKARFFKHGYSAQCMVNLDNQRIAVGFNNGAIMICDLTRFWLNTITINTFYSNINCLLYLTKDVIAAGTDSNIQIWDIGNSKPELIKVLTGHINQINCLQHLFNGLIASGSMDQTIRIWDMRYINNAKCVDILRYHMESVTCLEYFHEFIASGGTDGRIKIWHANE